MQILRNGWSSATISQFLGRRIVVNEAMSVTLTTAIVGIIISVAALTWNIIRYIWERRLKIDVMFTLKPSSGKMYLTVMMTNIGRRPIVVKEWGAKFKYERRLGECTFATQGLPRMLKEGGVSYGIHR